MSSGDIERLERELGEAQQRVEAAMKKRRRKGADEAFAAAVRHAADGAHRSARVRRRRSHRNVERLAPTTVSERGATPASRG